MSMINILFGFCSIFLCCVVGRYLSVSCRVDNGVSDPWNLADFYFENFRKNGFIPNDSEQFGIVNTEVGMAIIETEFRWKKAIERNNGKLCEITSFHVVLSTPTFPAGPLRVLVRLSPVDSVCFPYRTCFLYNIL